MEHMGSSIPVSSVLSIRTLPPEDQGTEGRKNHSGSAVGSHLPTFWDGSRNVSSPPSKVGSPKGHGREPGNGPGATRLEKDKIDCMFTDGETDQQLELRRRN